MGLVGLCAARRTEAGSSMGLVLWVLPGATTSQMRRGEHNNNARNSTYVSISQVDGRKEEVLSGEVCYMFSATCTTEITQGWMQQIRMMFERCAAAAGCM